MRETEFRAHDHRDQVPSGAYILTDGHAMDDLIDRLHNGWSEVGWEGDQRLALAYNRETARWELWRHEHDGEYRLVGVSKPGKAFPPDLIQSLVSVDGRRGYSLVQDLQRHEETRKTAEDYRFSQAMAPKAERLAWALRKDLNIGSKTFAGF